MAITMAQANLPQTAPNRTGDAELVQRARDRDEAAIRSIMKSNNRKLYRLARGILRNDSEAEDVVQETYVLAFTHLNSFRGESGLSTWLSRIAINEALGRLRRQRPAVEWTSLQPGELETNAQIIQFSASSAAANGRPHVSRAGRRIRDKDTGSERSRQAGFGGRLAGPAVELSSARAWRIRACGPCRRRQE